MATLDSRYKINGIIDTSRPVFENLETVTNSCATWLSYDGISGKWSVVINQAGSPVATFDDSNIIGGITLSTNNLSGIYNECEVRFHNLTLRDQEDYVLLATPSGQRLPNEPTNRLIINAPMVNNQIQAQLIGLIELKQSRLDRTIEFRTDYSRINLEAGDIISVTNSVYGWTNQEFRILRITEVEEAGSIVISITAQQYDTSIYSTADLYEYIRETETGLIELDPLVDTSPVTPSTAVLDANGDSMLGLLGANALIALLKKLMEDQETGSGSIFGEVFDILEGISNVDVRIFDQAGNGSPYEKIFEIFKDDTGTDIRDNIKSGAVYAYDIFSVSTGDYLYTAGDLITVPDGLGNNLDFYDHGFVNTAAQSTTASFTALETGTHVVQGQLIFSYNPSDYDQISTMNKSANISLVSTAGNTVVSSLGDTIRGDTFQDIPITFLANLTAGQSYYLSWGALMEQLNGVLGDSGVKMVARVTRSK